MYLASCSECNAPQGMFTSYDELTIAITNKKICWNCDTNFISSSSGSLINLVIGEFQDSQTLIDKSKDFWNYDWEDKYVKWLDEKKVEISEKTKNQYLSVRDSIKKQFEKSPLWVELSKKLGDFHYEYKAHKNGYNLLMSLELPELDEKKYDSFFLKTFRKNILQNNNPFEEPDDGWIFPDNWYTKINDIVRTCFVVKYLDGVDFLANKIEKICDEKNIDYVTSFEAKEEGYYAAHISVLQNFAVPGPSWDSTNINVWIEIQITTQLQEVIRKLLHSYYEDKRKTIVKEDVKWQWNYKSNEFATNYLGHILHYVEGMIVEIRDKDEVIL